MRHAQGRARSVYAGGTRQLAGGPASGSRDHLLDARPVARQGFRIFPPRKNLVTESPRLAALLRLYDDDSATVRETVLGVLASFGDELGEALRDLDESPSEAVVADVLAAVEAHVTGADQPGSGSSARVVLRIGQLVRHRQYAYRGVVVSRDAECRASDAWYRSNRSQPDRDQPWYHVLVDGRDSVTYAAHSSLEADDTEADVDHPLIEHFFDGKQSGRYRRNERPWPEIGG